MKQQQTGSQCLSINESVKQIHFRIMVSVEKQSFILNRRGVQDERKTGSASRPTRQNYNKLLFESLQRKPNMFYPNERLFFFCFNDIFLCSCCFCIFFYSLHLADGNNFGNLNWPKTNKEKQFELIKCQTVRGEKRGCFHVNIWFNYILHIYIKYLAHIRSFIKPLFFLEPRVSNFCFSPERYP